MRLDSPEYGKEMKEFFRTAGERYPNDPRILLSVGFAHELAGDLPQAQNSYDRAASNVGRMPQAQRDALIREIETRRLSLNSKRRASN